MTIRHCKRRSPKQDPSCILHTYPQNSPMLLVAPSAKPHEVVMDTVKRRQSLSTCSCSCHRVNKMKTPGSTQDILGTFTVHVRGMLRLTPACDEIACERSAHSSLRISYRFPPWLSSYALHSMIYSDRVAGPQMCLTSTRTVPRNSDIFCFAMQGDISGIQNLFTKRLASPFDNTHNYGYTALHYATDYEHYELCDFLLKAGCRSEVQDFEGRTSTDLAYRKMCEPTFEGSCANRFRELFNEESWLE